MVNTYNQYKIRVIAQDQGKEKFALTVPRTVAYLFEEVKFSLYISGGAITFLSGCDLNSIKKEIGRISFEQLQ